MHKRERAPPISIEAIEGEHYIGVTCVFFCHDGLGSFVLAKRSQNCRDEIGNWDCGSGALEFGESFEEAVTREIKEEYCCNVIDLNFLGVNNVLRNNNGKITHWIALIFAAQVDPEKVRIGESDKMEELGWFKPENLPQPLHSILLEHLEFVKKAGVI